MSNSVNKSTKCTVSVYSGINATPTFIETDVGGTLLDLLKENKFLITADCSGNGKCGKCLVKATGKISSASESEKKLLGDKFDLGFRLACYCKIEGDCEIEIINNSDLSVLTDFKGKTEISGFKKGLGIAVDIGTTTVAVYCYDLQTAEQIAVRATQNPQRSFGSDVISRIGNCRDKNNLQKMREMIIECISDLISLCKIDKSDIKYSVIAGNTTMLHILCGLDPSSIAAAPFEPQSKFGVMFNSRQLGFDFECDCYLTPCVSAYIGGDITAGMIAVNLDRGYQKNLLLDLGTNGEIALSCDGNIYCCSAAAGPVFEGALIKYGTASVDGAVNGIKNNNGKFEITTINNRPPVGMCGSGIIDALAASLQTGAVDQSGYLKSDFVICENPYIAITPEDVRQLQLAKSAVYSGIVRLCDEACIQFKDIDTVFLAGGFGSSINPQSAATVGLIPEELVSKCALAGNTAALGAAQALCDDRKQLRLEEVTDKCIYLELSCDKKFSDDFMNNIYFNTPKE